MGLLFVAIGLFFGVLLIVKLIIRTARRQRELGFSDILLAFMVALLLLSALIVSALDGDLNPTVNNAVFAAAVFLVLIGILTAFVEAFRPERLKQSGGVLVAGMGVLLVVARFLVPFTAVFFDLSAPPAAPLSPASPLVGQPVATLTMQDHAFDTFNGVVQIIREETDTDIDTLLVDLDSGETIAVVVERYGGDVERVVERLTEFLRGRVEILQTEGRVPSAQAALAITFMENIVRRGMNDDIRALLSLALETAESYDTDAPETVTDGTPAATGTPYSLFVMLTRTADPETPQGTIPPTQRPTLTVTLSLTASATRTPRPTDTATPTRERYASPTPSLTPTLPSPCVAVMLFNVNLRAEPTLDAELLATIPFESAVNAFQQTDDGEWLFVEYEGQAGWLATEFVTVTASCALLPTR